MTTSSLPKTVKSCAQSLLGVAALSAIAFVGVPQSAEAANIIRGTDYLFTPADGSTFFNFGGPIGNVAFMGNPIDTVNLGNADTIVQRKQDCIFSGNIPACTIDIEMTKLSLKSINSVNLEGSFFDVFVTLDERNIDLNQDGQRDNLSTGKMTINHEFPENFTPNPEGTFSSILNVFFKAEFKKVSGNGPNDFSIFGSSAGTNAFNAVGYWSHEPHPNALLVTPNSPTVMNQIQDPNCHAAGGPLCATGNLRDFHIFTTPHEAPGHRHTVSPACRLGQPCPPPLLPVCPGGKLCPQPPKVPATVVPEPSAALGTILVGLTAMFSLKKKQQSQKA